MSVMKLKTTPLSLLKKKVPAAVAARADRLGVLNLSRRRTLRATTKTATRTRMTLSFRRLRIDSPPPAKSGARFPLGKKLLRAWSSFRPAAATTRVVVAAAPAMASVGRRAVVDRRSRHSFNGKP